MELPCRAKCKQCRTCEICCEHTYYHRWVRGTNIDDRELVVRRVMYEKLYTTTINRTEMCLDECVYGRGLYQ